MSTIAHRLEALQEQFARDVTTLADEVRASHVEPLCRKYGVEFLSGNGTYGFYFGMGVGDLSIGGMDYEIAQAPKRMQRALREAFELLDLEVGRDDYLGYYVADVRKTR